MLNDNFASIIDNGYDPVCASSLSGVNTLETVEFRPLNVKIVIVKTICNAHKVNE